MTSQEYVIVGGVMTIAVTLANIIRDLIGQRFPKMKNGNGAKCGWTHEDRACLQLLVARFGIGPDAKDVAGMVSEIQLAIRRFAAAPADHEEIMRLLREVRSGISDCTEVQRVRGHREKA